MNAPSVLVFGRHGQLAEELLRAPLPEKWSLTALGRADCDIADADSVARAIDAHAPSVIINAAAYTAVDAAETDAGRAFAVNRDGPLSIARAAAAACVPLVHISTDYVFDGQGATPYREDDPTGPINVYGASKLAGEDAVRSAGGPHLILRTSWVYSAFGSNFVRTMLRLASRPELGVVDDQRGCPTAAADLARMAIELSRRAVDGRIGAWGTYHLCGAGATSWHGLASAIFAIAGAAGGAVPRLKAIATSEYPTPAARPAYSVLDCGRFNETFALSLPPWRESLAVCLAELLGVREGVAS